MDQMKNLWNKRAGDHKSEQESNPFSGSGSGGGSQKLSRKDPNYGKAKEGSKTAQRAKQARAWVEKEVNKLVGVIKDLGHPDDEGFPCIEFGPLFIAYQDISDTLVGILMRAKKRKRLRYQGDMLFQGCHNHVVITLTEK